MLITSAIEEGREQIVRLPLDVVAQELSPLGQLTTALDDGEVRTIAAEDSRANGGPNLVSGS